MSQTTDFRFQKRVTIDRHSEERTAYFIGAAIAALLLFLEMLGELGDGAFRLTGTIVFFVATFYALSEALKRLPKEEYVEMHADEAAALRARVERDLEQAQQNATRVAPTLTVDVPAWATLTPFSVKTMPELEQWFPERPSVGSAVFSATLVAKNSSGSTATTEVSVSHGTVDLDGGMEANLRNRVYEATNKALHELAQELLISMPEKPEKPRF
jgi:hypothetical protein